jgi:hypothetical protein
VEGARASWEQKSQKMTRLHATRKALKGRVDNCDAIQVLKISATCQFFGNTGSTEQANKQ